MADDRTGQGGHTGQGGPTGRDGNQPPESLLPYEAWTEAALHQVNEFFGLIWDDADELARLARLSNPRVTVNTAGLTPEQTALANRLAQSIHRLPPETVAALHAVLDTTTPQTKPKLRRAARKGG